MGWLPVHPGGVEKGCLQASGWLAPWPAGGVRNIKVTMGHEVASVKCFADSLRLKPFCLPRTYGEAVAFQERFLLKGECEQK